MVLDKLEGITPEVIPENHKSYTVYCDYFSRWYLWARDQVELKDGVYEQVKDNLPGVPFKKAQDFLGGMEIPMDPSCFFDRIPKEPQASIAGLFLSAAMDLSEQESFILSPTAFLLDHVGYELPLNKSLVNYATVLNLGQCAYGAITNFGEVKKDMGMCAENYSVLVNNGSVLGHFGENSRGGIIINRGKGRTRSVLSEAIRYDGDSLQMVGSLNTYISFQKHENVYPYYCIHFVENGGSSQIDTLKEGNFCNDIEILYDIFKNTESASLVRDKLGNNFVFTNGRSLTQHILKQVKDLYP